jgi:putative SOS response-associated peptidase YedK
MCGRYRLTAKERYLHDHFGLDEDPFWAPRWNIAPTQPVAVIRQDAREPKRTFGLLRWGLIPYWAKDASIGFRTISPCFSGFRALEAQRIGLNLWTRRIIPELVKIVRLSSGRAH